MSHGLPDDTVNCIATLFSQYPGIEKAVLYGSRAKGNYRTGSDIDLVLFGNLDHAILARLNDALDALPTPYKIDLSIHSDLTHPDLIGHINRVGVIFYKKQELEPPVHISSNLKG